MKLQMKCTGMIALLAIFIAGETQARQYECNRSTPQEGKGRVICTKGNFTGDMCILCDMFKSATPQELNDLCASEFPECSQRCPAELVEQCKPKCANETDIAQCEKKCHDDFNNCRNPCKAQKEHTLDMGCPL